MIGVSPAYFLSASGPSFGPYDIIAGLPLLAELGYGAFQAELFEEERLEAWTPRSASDLRAKAAALGLSCEVFVAHFLGSRFASLEALLGSLDDDNARRAMDAAQDLCDGGVFALPLPPLSAGASAAALASPGKGAVYDALLGRLDRLVTGARSAGLTLALELMPGNALGGPADFLRLCEEPGFGELGIVFDTGHFWAMGEAPEGLPALFGRRIAATHLCDNDGVRNLSLCPGDGTIDFEETMKGLRACGYAGGLDLEIVCARENLAAEYGRGIGVMAGLAAGTARLHGPTALSPH